LDFDGKNDYINVPHNNALSLTETLTFTAWIKPNSIGTNYNTVLAKDSGAGADSNYWFGLWQNELDFGFFSGSTFREVFTSGLNIQANTWQYIAASFNNATDEVFLYLNGVLVYTGSLSFTPSVTTADLTIGRSPIGEYWHGLLDDVRIYDTVLSTTEISDLYAAGNVGGGSTAVCNGTFRDEFNAKALNGSTGSIDWSPNPWAEVGESDGITKGDIQILNDISNFQLKIKGNGSGGKGMQREANLDGATSATLNFDYRRKGLDNNIDYVSVYISSTGTAGPWTELDQIGTTNDAIYQPYSRDISSFISSTTAIRLTSSPGLGNKDKVFFDNLQIKCTP